MFQIPNVKFVYIYPKPVNMHWGERKLSQLCEEEMGIDPKAGDVFLFFNTKKDQMKLFFCDEDGSQEFLKMLPQGGFMLPAPAESQKYIKVARAKLNSLFRTTLLT